MKLKTSSRFGTQFKKKIFLNKKLNKNSKRNHTYVEEKVNFYWAKIFNTSKNEEHRHMGAIPMNWLINKNSKCDITLNVDGKRGQLGLQNKKK